MLNRKLTTWLIPSALAALAWLAFAPAVRAEQDVKTKTLKVKAAYVFNFAKFTTWPDRAFDHKKAPLVIGVLDDEPFTRILDATVRGMSVSKRAVKIRRLSLKKRDDWAKFSQCHVLYVGQSARQRLGDILGAVAETPVLVVSDIRNFATRGGMIGLMYEAGRVGFEVNRKALEQTGLRASSKLLKHATIVESQVTDGKRKR